MDGNGNLIIYEENTPNYLLQNNPVLPAFKQLFHFKWHLPFIRVCCLKKTPSHIFISYRFFFLSLWPWYFPLYPMTNITLQHVLINCLHCGKLTKSLFNISSFRDLSRSMVNYMNKGLVFHGACYSFAYYIWELAQVHSFFHEFIPNALY